MVAMDGDGEWGGEGAESGCSYKRASGELLVVTELLCILTVSMSVP